jgi:hypothetical protein
VGAGNMNGKRRAPIQTSPTFVSVYTVLPRTPGYLTPLAGWTMCSLKIVPLPYTLCDITSRPRPVLMIQRALLFLVDQEAVPLMTLHLSVPSSVRESVPIGRRWCRIPASSRGPLRVYDSRYCCSITVPRIPEEKEVFMVIVRNDEASKRVAVARNEKHTQLQFRLLICPARDRRTTALHQVSTCFPRSP